MRQAIVVATTPDRYQWLNNLLQTLDGYDDWPIVIFSDYLYEVGKIKKALLCGFDEFFLLQDSVEVLDASLFDLVFNQYKGKTVTVSPSMRSFLVKYRSDFLENIILPPIPKNKIEAVDAEDYLFYQHTREDDTVVSLTDDFNKSSVFQEKFGRKNMVVTCRWLKKYKATWNRQQLS